MRLGKKLFLYSKEKSSQDRISYFKRVQKDSDVFLVPNERLEKTKLDRRKNTYNRGVNRPLYEKLPLPIDCLPPEINDSIETLPLWYWWEIQKTGNVRLLDINKSKNKSYKFLFYCAAIWDDMQDQHIAEFGIPKGFHEKTKAKSKYAQAKALHAVSQNNWDLTLMNFAKDELDKLKTKGKPISNYKEKNRIQIALGIPHIDARQIKVIEYFHLMEDASKANEDVGRT